MATSASAHLRMLLDVEGIPASPLEGVLRKALENATGGRRWTQGTGSGEIDRIYIRERSALGAAATDNYDLLGAGGLNDIHGQAIDADELKAIFLLPTDGSILFEAPAANYITLFSAATDATEVPSDGMLLSWGADGLDVTVNSKFDITEVSGAVTADYLLAFICAQ